MKSYLKKLISLLSLTALTLFFISTSAIADEYLSKQKIKALFVNKTVYSEHLHKDLQFKVYFDADGKTAYRTRKDEIIKTTYTIKGDKHCIYWNDADRCASILDNGDGSYTRVKNDKKIIKWYKVVDGKHLQ